MEKSVLIFTQNNTRDMFDKYQYKIWGKNENSFVGKKMCGSSCFVLKYLLEDLGHDVKVFKNTRQDEHGIEDHVFLYTCGHIVDPTWRQFMIDSRSKDNKCKYRQNLFYNYEPIMVQKPKNANKQIQNLIDSNSRCYGSSFTDFEDIKTYWDFEKDDTDKYNLHEYMKNHALLNGKPDYYKELIGFISYSRILGLAPPRSPMQEPVQSFNPYKLERSGKLDKYMGFAYGDQINHTYHKK